MAKAVKQNELAKDLELYIKVGKYSNFASVKKSPRDKVTYVDYLNTSYKKMQNMLDDLQDSYFIEGISGKKIPLENLTYWNVDLQEAYFSYVEASQKREKSD